MIDFPRGFCFLFKLEEHELESLTLRERARRSWQSRPVVVRQQQDFSVEWRSRLSQVRVTVVTDRSGGTRLSRSERLRAF